MYLIDKNGYIVYSHIGEGAYDRTEQEIQNLLQQLHANTGAGLATTSNMPTATSTIAGSYCEDMLQPTKIWLDNDKLQLWESYPHIMRG